ncbi:hypothetical protein BDF20DRAFT_909639 [Mycotypha africana]|uniref:uncharacterized protein n=1 Tax=Mycotypha africana TaxID=64632 RepID=UPI0022FFF52B|nr:uncharacterized protein BDF20DRAFT_909639 [Mycotypha africana]KAI8991933.1 hypothetical protein BDF20DRAFT_909639 [Mycotypha africana]
MLKRKAVTDSSSSKRQAKTTAISSSSTEPWELVLNDGKEAIKEKDFKRAVSLFTRALELKPNHATVLEYRAASYEKLDQLNLALQDATTMIRHDPTSARGYLRAGKILSLQKKHKSAVTIYKRGLKNISVHDARYQQIKDMLAAAERILHPSPTHDPMRYLPYDIMSTIFSMLSFERRIQCTSVSQSWRSFALSWPGMWRDLDFSDKKISVATIKKYLGHAKGRHVRRLSVRSVARNKLDKILQLLIDEDCQYLNILELSDCEIPVTTFLRLLRLIGKHITYMNLDYATLTMDAIVRQVIPRCPKLTHLTVNGVPDIADITKQAYTTADNDVELHQLTHVRIVMNDVNNIKWLLRKCPKLELLDIKSEDVRFNDIAETVIHESLNSMRKFRFSRAILDSSTIWPAAGVDSWVSKTNHRPSDTSDGLEAFYIVSDPSFTGSMLRGIVQRSFRTLKQLVLRDCRSVGDSLAHLATSPGLPCLEKLECGQMEEDDIRTILTACPTLQDVTIGFTIGMTDNAMSDLAANVKKLKRLDITGCPHVTGVGLEKVVKAHRSTLEKVNISQCFRISVDAIEWATSVLGKRVLEANFNTRSF